MRIYVDEDSIESHVMQLLRKAGHDVQLPSEADLMERSDPVQLLHAINERRVLLSMNHDDFEALHDLVKGSGGRVVA